MWYMWYICEDMMDFDQYRATHWLTDDDQLLSLYGGYFAQDRQDPAAVTQIVLFCQSGQIPTTKAN